MSSVLVVDDNEMNRDVLGRRLEKAGYEVITVEDGTKALDVLENHKFDLILLDIMMPEMDGFETLEKIRAREATLEVPIIMLTSVNELDDVKRCISLGANDYVLKPYDIDELKKRIESLIA
jgi:CheY-like chemotaxis protein